MKKYYLIPTWLLLFMAIVTDMTAVKILAFLLGGIQSIQLILYSNDAWLMKKAKLIIFSIFSIGEKYDENERTEAEKKYFEEIECELADFQKEITDKKDNLESENHRLESEIETRKQAVHHDIYVMYRNAEEKCRVIIQEANNNAAAIEYKAREKAEEQIQIEINKRIIPEAEKARLTILEDADQKKREIIERANSDKEKIIESANKKAELILEDAYRKSSTSEFISQKQEFILSSAKNEADKIYDAANEEAKKIREEAKDYYRKTMDKAIDDALAYSNEMSAKSTQDYQDRRSEANRILNEAKINAQNTIRDAKNEYDRIINEADGKRLLIIKGELENNIPKQIFLTEKWESFDASEQAELICVLVNFSLNMDLDISEENFFASERLKNQFSFHLKEEFEQIDTFDGNLFEQYCASILGKIGFLNIEITPYSGDYGADILCEKDCLTYAIQCKRSSDYLGNKAVQEIYSGKEFYKKNVGIVMTNSKFTSSAKIMSKETGIRLWDRRMLCKFICIMWIRDIIGL